MPWQQSWSIRFDEDEDDKGDPKVVEVRMEGGREGVKKRRGRGSST